MAITAKRPVGAVQRPIERFGDARRDVHVPFRGPNPGVLHPQLQVMGPSTAQREPPRSQPLELHVPNPRDVLAIGDAVVQQHQRIQSLRLGGQQVQDLIRAGGILGQENHHLTLRALDHLGPSERRTGGNDRVQRRVRCNAQRPRGGHGGGNVVGAVQTRAAAPPPGNVDRRSPTPAPTH